MSKEVEKEYKSGKNDPGKTAGDEKLGKQMQSRRRKRKM
jgi:hypothetical protein